MSGGMRQGFFLAACAAAAVMLTGPAGAQVVVNPQALRQLGGPAPARNPAVTRRAMPDRREDHRIAEHRKPAHRAVRHAVKHPVAAHVAAARLPMPPPPPPVIATRRPAPPPKPPAKPVAPAPLVIVFPGDEATPGPAAAASVRRFLAASRPRGLRFLVRATAPGGSDDPSEARRLALRRGLAVRGMLVAAGIPAQRIIVQALGDAPDAPDDRVTLSTLP